MAWKNRSTFCGKCCFCKSTFTFRGFRKARRGWRKTSKADDKTIMKTFIKCRPDGHGVDSRQVHAALPSKLRKKVVRRTVIRRVAEHGYKPTVKANKSDPGPALALRRKNFGISHQSKTEAQWKSYLDGVGDFKDFTFYPQELQPRFEQLRAPWTYMHVDEKFKPAFVRGKRWFKPKDWKKVRKQKVFGLTTSTGKSLAFLVPPKPFDSTKWAKLVTQKVGPFLKKAFPTKTSFRILLDGEPLLRADPAKAAMKEQKISLLEGWPKYSPDLNPQEHVWAGAEKSLRAASKPSDTFKQFGQRCLKATRAYPGSKKLVASMAKRMKMVVDGKGAMIKK